MELFSRSRRSVAGTLLDSENIWLTALLEPIVLIIVVMWIALKAKPLFIFAKIYDFSYWLYLIHYPIIMVVKYLCLQQV